MDEQELAEFRAWKAAKAAQSVAGSAVANAVNPGMTASPAGTAAPTTRTSAPVGRRAPVDAMARIATAASAAGSDELTRRSAGVSVADWDKRKTGGWDKAWTDGTFKSATGRYAIMENDLADRRSAGRAAVTSRLIAQGRAPVGGTSAVVDNTSGMTGNTRVPAVRPIGQQQADARASTVGIVDRYAEPGSARTTFAPPTAPRATFIAGADGRNVASDFVAGGRYSSADTNGVPRPAATVAAAVRAPLELPRQRDQRAVRPRYFAAR